MSKKTERKFQRSLERHAAEKKFAAAVEEENAKASRLKGFKVASVTEMANTVLGRKAEPSGAPVPVPLNRATRRRHGFR